jgi:nucleoside 2-deoxyribosyltransferase
MMRKRIYLAGPEVFLSNAREIGARKRAICEQHRLIGVFLADEEDVCDPALSRPDQGLAISRAMERVMRTCDAMIVNLTPFRGPSADVGSAYEMGLLFAYIAQNRRGRPLISHQVIVQLIGSPTSETGPDLLRDRWQALSEGRESL